MSILDNEIILTTIMYNFRRERNYDQRDCSSVGTVLQLTFHSDLPGAGKEEGSFLLFLLHKHKTAKKTQIRNVSGEVKKLI